MSERLNKKTNPIGTVELSNWIIFAGRIQGTPHNRKEIITSKIISLNGTIVKTKNGSYYKLLDPNPQMSEEWLKQFNNSSTPFEALEKVITENLVDSLF